VIVPRRNWTRLTDMVEDLHRKYSSSAYVFRNNYFFLDLPPQPREASNITFLRYRRKVRSATHRRIIDGNGFYLQSAHLRNSLLYHFNTR